MDIKKLTNGHPKNNGKPQKEELRFPVSYVLKAVFDVQADDVINKKGLEALFAQLDIRHSFEGVKISSKGTYKSYSYQVTLHSKAMMEKLYSELKSLPGLKTAL
ncbi:MAG: DUF493 family protein [Bacteroidales bacterium]|jgi:putative lipoic acid-binding regulatory protein